MRQNKPLLILSTLIALSPYILANQKLVTKYCASCHLLSTPTPDIIPSMNAPAMDGVLFHLKEALSSDKKVKSFIVDYVQEPKLSKTLCQSNRVKKFGLMPSMKNTVTIKELESISDYIIQNYPTKEFVDMLDNKRKNSRLKSLKNSPFLINRDSMPHLTKILMKNWDKGTLALDEKQKETLLRVRQDTLIGVRKIKKELARLEAEVVSMTVDGEELTLIAKKVEHIANLKKEATMLQIKCLQDSTNILDDRQIELLLPFWDL
jgi:hypothetical protein